MTGLLGNAVIVPEEEEEAEEAVAGGSGWVVSRCVNISPSYMYHSTGQETGRELSIEAGISTVKRLNLKRPYVRYEARKWR